jgi:hypothetical protein
VSSTVAPFLPFACMHAVQPSASVSCSLVRQRLEAGRVENAVEILRDACPQLLEVRRASLRNPRRLTVETGSWDIAWA